MTGRSTTRIRLMILAIAINLLLGLILSSASSLTTYARPLLSWTHFRLFRPYGRFYLGLRKSLTLTYSRYDQSYCRYHCFGPDKLSCIYDHSSGEVLI